MLFKHLRQHISKKWQLLLYFKRNSFILSHRRNSIWMLLCLFFELLFCNLNEILFFLKWIFIQIAMLQVLSQLSMVGICVIQKLFLINNLLRNIWFIIFFIFFIFTLNSACKIIQLFPFLGWTDGNWNASYHYGIWVVLDCWKGDIWSIDFLYLILIFFHYAWLVRYFGRWVFYSQLRWFLFRWTAFNFY